jgi:hypothetical protein
MAAALALERAEPEEPEEVEVGTRSQFDAVPLRSQALTHLQLVAFQPEAVQTQAEDRQRCHATLPLSRAAERLLPAILEGQP